MAVACDAATDPGHDPTSSYRTWCKTTADCEFAWDYCIPNGDDTTSSQSSSTGTSSTSSTASTSSTPAVELSDDIGENDCACLASWQPQEWCGGSEDELTLFSGCGMVEACDQDSKTWCRTGPACEAEWTYCTPPVIADKGFEPNSRVGVSEKPVICVIQGATAAAAVANGAYTSAAGAPGVYSSDGGLQLSYVGAYGVWAVGPGNGEFYLFWGGDAAAPPTPKQRPAASAWSGAAWVQDAAVTLVCTQ